MFRIIGKEANQLVEKEVYPLIEVEEVCQLIINLDQEVKVEVTLPVQPEAGLLDGEKVNPHHHQLLDEVHLILHKLNFLIIIT